MPASQPRKLLPLLVGREREQASLRDSLTATLGGHGGLVLIGGEAGIGKTALAEALCDEAAQRGARVLVGRCYDLTETPPYGPWVELFGQYGSPGDFPALPPPFARRGSVGEVANPAILFAQVHGFFSELGAGQPTLLFLDDLHWADPASLDLLRTLARNLSALPVLIIGAYRADEVTRTHPLYTLLPALVREAQASRLDLRRLDSEAMRALVRARYAVPEHESGRLVAYLDERAEGNPFFIGELLRTLEEEAILQYSADGWQLGDVAHVRLPTLLKQVMDARLMRLGEETQQLLAIAAVIGQEIPLSLWATVARVSEMTLLDVVQRAVEAHVLEERDDGVQVRFVHALIRQALYDGLLPALLPSRRRGWHLRVGEAQMAESNPDPDAIAYHFRQAGDVRAVEWLMKAGERAERAGAWVTAAQRFEAALTLADGDALTAEARGWLLVRVGLLLRFARPQAGIAPLEAAIRLGTQSGNDLLVACATYICGALRCYFHDFQRGLAQVEEGSAALDRLPAADSVRLAALDLVGEPLDTQTRWVRLALFLAFVGRCAEACALGEKAVSHFATMQERGTDASSGPYPTVYRALGIAYATLGQPERACAAFREACAALGAMGLDAGLASSVTDELNWAVLPYRADNRAMRQAVAAEGEAVWVRANGVLHADLLSPQLARLSLMVIEGAWDEARDVATAAHAVDGVGFHQRLVRAPLGMLACYRGETETAWRVIRAVFTSGPETEPGGTFYLSAMPLQRLAATLAIEANDAQLARRWLEAHDRWLDWGGAALGRSEGHLLWAGYERAAGSVNRARERAMQALTHATEPRQPLALLAAHRFLGELDTDAGRVSDAWAHLDTALCLAERCAAPFECALMLAALAALRATTGNQTVAQRLLDEAHEIAVSLGAKPLLARVATLAARFGGIPDAPARRSGARAYPGGLTAREVDVLRLIAAGRTDREIAETLALSTRTVSNYVLHILNKTDARNRTAAAAFAFRHGLA